MSKFTLKLVSDNPSVWSKDDPVRPELDAEFKTAPGRGVFGLQDPDGAYRAFLCYARTTQVPASVEELEKYTSVKGRIIVPYTVWSYQKGAGREIINEIIWMVRNSDVGVDRVVTLSPQTAMAKRFHIRNKAIELRVNQSTVNFEYQIEPTGCMGCGCDPCDCDWGNS
jgi:hypothetical protein